MAHLDIAFLTGDTERRELNKQQPLSIGSHKSNDLQLDESGVELIHCRISWNKSAFEAVAAGVDPIDVNGAQVQRANLKDGDVLRIGSVDITFLGGGNGDAAAAAGTSSPGLKPITSELPSYLDESGDEPEEEFESSEPDPEPVRSKTQKKSSSRGPAGKKSSKSASGGGDDWMEGLAAESQVDLPAHTEAPPSESEMDFGDQADEDDEDEPKVSRAAGGRAMSDRLRSALHHQRERPGEEDTLRSPLVLGLGGLAVTLMLLAAVFYFIGKRRSTQEEFDAARAVFNEGKYAQAITLLQEFANTHLGHPLEQSALMLSGLATADRHLTGAVKDWPKGLDALKTFIQDCRDYEEFESEHPGIADRASRIARGAAQAAAKTYDRSLLKVSDDAVSLVNTYSPKDAPPTEFLQEVARLRRESEAEILRHETFDEALTSLTGAIESGDPMRALEIRRDLLVRYPEFAKDQRLAKEMQATLQAEVNRTTVESLDRPALTEDDPAAGALTLVFYARSRTDVVSVNEAVCVLAKDCLYGVDTIMGAPVWRRVIGLNTPFFPLREPGTPSLIAFDTRRNELIRLHQNTGELMWRQPLGEPVAGQPLLDEGQLYVPTRSGSLFKIDLQSGAASTRVQFSQSISGPVALLDRTHLVVAGDRDVLYTLTKQPLECVATSYLAQQPGSVEAPLLSIGPYVLMSENTGARQSKVRLLQASDPAKLTEVASAGVSGRVLDLPVIRGRDLFVPSTGERIAAMTVSDDRGQPPLIVGPTYQVQGGGESTIYLATGPDRQLWMAASALRKLQLTATALEADQTVVAIGLSTQPLQYVGGTMFNARQRPFTSAVTFTQTNRDELTSDWQAVVGARIIASNSVTGDRPSLICVTEAGHVFRTSPQDWQQGGFFGDAVRLPLSAELRDPIFATPYGEGQLAVAAGGDEPRLWLISRLGQVDSAYSLDAAPEAAPAAMGGRFLLPIQGRLALSSRPGQPPVEPYALPSDEAEQARWRQVIAVDEQNAVAITESGQVLQVRQQSNPRSHLAEVTRIDLQAPVNVAADVQDGQIAIADTQQQVRVLDALTLDATGRRTFDAPVTNDVWLVGDAVFVETDSTQLHCLERGVELPSRWEQPLELDGTALAGRPLDDGDSLIVALVDGRVLRVSAATGEKQAEMHAGCRLAGGPLELAGEQIVTSLDGSLIRVSELAPQ